MINVQLLPINCQNFPFVIIETNKKMRLYSVTGDFVNEISILPKISLEEKEKLIQSGMVKNVFKFLKEYYFIVEDHEGFSNYKIPIIRKVASSYEYVKEKEFLLPSPKIRNLSFSQYKNLYQEINKKSTKKYLEKLESDILKQNCICTEIITGLSPNDIPDKYLIAYHNLSTYILIDKNWAQNVSRKNKGILTIFVSEDYLMHVIGANGRNIKKIAKKLCIRRIIVNKK